MAPTNLTHPAQTDQPDVVIGVDTHKDFHVAVALATNGARLGECSIPANRLGYAVLQDWALEMGRRPVFAVEGTGERKLGAFEGSGQSSLEAGTVEHGAALAVVFPAHYRLCGPSACG